MNGHGSPIEDVGVDHGGFDTAMAHQFLDRANVIAIFKQVGGKCVAQGMAGSRLVNFGLLDRPFDRFLKAGVMEMVAAGRTGAGVGG